MSISFALGFLLGVLAILAAEAFFLYWITGWLVRRSAAAAEAPPITSDRHAVERPLTFPVSKQGTVWVLEPEKVPKHGSDESPTKGPKERKQKKGIIEVYPVKKYAKIKDRCLSLSDVDGSQAVIQLLDCKVLAVSASDLSTRKWAKRYPIKLESENSIIYKGSRTCYIYFETSWEKESWCKALRVASCSDREQLNWFAQLTEEFHQYLVSLSAEDPSFLKPPALLFDEATDKSNRVDGSSSRVRSFLRKLTKKGTKNAIDFRTSSISSSAHGERKNYVKIRPPLDASSSDESIRSSIEENSMSSSLKDLVQPGSPTCGKNLLPIIPDSVIGEKIVNGEGTLCWNLLFSRLFFDARRSTWLSDVIKTRIQKTLSNMRTPSYIGGVTCTGLNLGNLPPFIHKIRVLPMDLNEEWTVEVDIEYSGGIVLDFETRIEVCEPELEKDIMGTSHAPISVGGMTSDLLEGIEDYGNLLRSSSTYDLVKNRDEVDKVDGLKVKSTKWTSSYASRWKAALQSIIANQVSQVPLSLAMQITSLRGTLRIHIKPPPSDQIWFGFTSMPEIEWNLDSSIGERKIVSSHVALFLGNRVKVSIRDSLVVPNYESITVPWMSAEKDDWVSVRVAPFMWNNQEATDTTGLESTISPPEDGKTKLDGRSGHGAESHHSDKIEEIRNELPQQPPEQSLPGTNASQSNSLALFSTSQSLERSLSEEMREPLIRTEETKQTQEQSGVESPQASSLSSQPQETLMLEQDSMHLEDDGKPKRMGSRRKMFDIGKKVGERLGEKFEEKRRHLGEKGRHLGEKSRSLVEKMREKQNRDA